jgi:2'-5' RNA ligase
MSSNLVIVAIPAADELVWKVSTEKVPHLTLLFLGPLEQDDNVQRMADFIEHAITVSEHGPFYLDVDHRGTLGSDNADVLFFRDDWSMKWIKSFRGQLLQQNDIRAEWEEMEAAGQQYDEWTPHLTLGYPETPAKPIPDDRSIYSVMFDRIALWTGDYEGPEFRLEWPVRRGDMAYPSLAYSGTSSRGQQFIKSVTHASVLDSPTLRQQIEDKLKDILEDVTGDADGDVALFGDPLLRAKVTSVLNDLYNAASAKTWHSRPWAKC